MNSTKILFLNMLKGDIKRYIYEKKNAILLTGQTISQNEIEVLSSFKLMNSDEREVILSILDSMKNKSSAIEKTTSSQEEGKVYLKSIPGLVPKDTTEVVDIKEAA